MSLFSGLLSPQFSVTLLEAILRTEWQQPGLYQASTQHRSVCDLIDTEIIPKNRPIFPGCSGQRISGKAGRREPGSLRSPCIPPQGTSLTVHLPWEKQQRRKTENKKWWGGLVTREKQCFLKKSVSLGKAAHSNSFCFFPLFIISLLKGEEWLSLNSRYSVC